jgi:hypothetical protein
MARGHVEIVHESEIASEEMSAAGWPPGARLQTLSLDDETGALTGLLSLPAGYRRGRGSLVCASEFFVLSGTMRCGEDVRAVGHYGFVSPAATQEPWAVDEDCRLLFMAGGVPDFAPGVGDGDPQGGIALDTVRLPWARGRVPGPPPGLFSKVLRHDEETGARVFLCGSVPRYDYPLIEYHDCHEEAYQIAGDIRIGTSGLMRAGSYFWRPPYVTHGPFFSRGGMLALMTVDGPLVNHYVDDPGRTVEENRAEALAEGPPRDYFAESKAAARAVSS